MIRTLLFNNIPLERQVIQMDLLTETLESGAPNENIVQNHLNIALLNVR